MSTEDPDRRNLYIALAAAGVVIVALLVVVLTKGGSSTQAAPPPVAAVTEPTSEIPEQTTATTPEPTAVSSSSVEQVLSEYQSDYSSKNAEALRGLFSVQLTRTDGSKPSEDLEQAMQTYEKQFSELKQPRYTLSSISVEPGSSEATAGAQYSISSQYGTVNGTISFGFVEQEGRLLIDSIQVTPSK